MRHVGLLVLVSGCRGLLGHLVLRASTASGRHYTFAAPGRAQGISGAAYQTVEITVSPQ